MLRAITAVSMNTGFFNGVVYSGLSGFILAMVGSANFDTKKSSHSIWRNVIGRKPVNTAPNEMIKLVEM